MKIVRQVTHQDLSYLMQLASSASSGLTTLPAKEERLQDKIYKSIESFSAQITEISDELYFFVMEETDTNKVVGCSAIEAMVGLQQPFFSYRVSNLAEYSKAHKQRKAIRYLNLVSDYNGATEICSLYLMPRYRKQYNGKLLSLSRFLYMANQKNRFNDRVFADLRGVSDKNGYSPFWQALGKNFFNVDFTQADYLSGLGDRQFIYDLMPRLPIYVNLLPPSAQEVIGETHENTLPARKMLEAQGFQYRGYINIFDAGPSVDCQLNQIATIQASKVLPIAKITSHIEHGSYLLSNINQRFKACISPAMINDNEHVVLHRDAAEALALEEGDHIRIVSMGRWYE